MRYLESERVLDGVLASTLMTMLSSTGSVVVLERLPRAAGRTRWFVCDNPADLSNVIDVLRPASRVSFYFDDRVAEVPVDDHLRRMIPTLLAEQPDFVLARRSTDEVELEVEFVGSISEADELLTLCGSASRVFIGRFPSADDDGVSAITALVPDADGTARREPH